MFHNIKHFNIPVFIPELGCPFRCIFCNQNSITGKKNYPSSEEIIQIIEKHLLTIKNRGLVEIGFFGGNFTGIPEETQKIYLSIANSYLKRGLVNGIRVSTRPDYINDKKLEILKNYGVTAIELGVQSLNDEVLKISKRGYTKDDVIRSSQKIKEYGFRLGHQIMIGLPASDINKEIETAKEVLKIGAEDIRIYPLLVLKDTEIEKMYQNKEYKPLSLEEAVIRTKEVLKLLYTKTNIIRVGLHPSSEIQNNNFFGPFHPSFKELVMTKLWEDVVYKIIEEFKEKEITININPMEYNYFIGYRKENKKILSKNFNLKILKSEKIDKAKVLVISSQKTKEFSLL